ncbi:MAG: CCA tRNA nucleotidyltransferase [Sulfurimonas sp.]|uniref:CCA tRNA nucleotidyltransferase n=1 Tax=Sulfurimonas sp. TaxID=2022749 RepID=UPI0026041E76|nr:CCA tRNA nucleotidyltransferase [Sulfurimonas sp.]MCW8896295.1 CCA tRNA nucleotidyltransferase [Sulfurimonas sp.]MCW8954925.1 CCA tRNA nucleotidyltransferase [Sulfurimonas sp.]MCW9068398.1 CCA tRNA nucleotidyltransferase [Sulfurimonas sp.]
MIDYPEQLNIIFNKLSEHKATAILVGGFVRDKLLGIDSKDIDIEVYGISSFVELENILQKFGDVNSVGKSFGVCKLQYADYDLDFSLPRVDSKISSGHTGFDVKINPNLDFKTAASRRDFTINAIGYDVKEKKFLDPFGGIDDLKNKTLRAVDKNTFIQDPLRVFRAAQFYARFELKIDKELAVLCKEMVQKGMLKELAKERIFEEIKKLLLKSKKPSIGFELLKKFGSDIYTKNIHVLDEITSQLTSDTNTNIVLMLAALCYDFDETSTEKFILKLSDEKEVLKRVLPLVMNHDNINKIYFDGLDDYSLYKLSSKVKIEELLILAKAIHSTKSGSNIYEAGDAVRKRALELHVLDKKLAPLLKGKDILACDLEPSPKFSEILNLAYEAQMKSEFNSREMAVKWLKKYLLTHS